MRIEGLVWTDLPVDLCAVPSLPPTPVVDDLKSAKSDVSHQIPAGLCSWKVGAGFACIHSCPVEGLAGANHVKHIVDIDKLDLPAKSDESPEVSEVCHIVFGASDIPDEEVVPEEGLGVLLDTSFLDRAIRRQVCLKWLLCKYHHTGRWVLSSDMSSPY